MTILHYYRKSDPKHSLLTSIKEELKGIGLDEESNRIRDVATESCFNVEPETELSEKQVKDLEWLLAETFDPSALQLEKSSLEASGNAWVVEFGPRMAFTSAFSSNAVSICQMCNIPISRLELSRRFRFELTAALSDKAKETIKHKLHDRMTQEEYKVPISKFGTDVKPQPCKVVPIMKEGRKALERVNEEMGLGFDDFDLNYYTNLFKVCMLKLELELDNLTRCLYRTSLGEIQLMWNASIWDSQIQSTRDTGFLEGK